MGVWEKSESNNYIPFGDVVKNSCCGRAFVKVCQLLRERFCLCYFKSRPCFSTCFKLVQFGQMSQVATLMLHLCTRMQHQCCDIEQV
jgi:hypothetical protein